MLIQYSITNRFIASAVFWLFYIGLSLVIAAVLPAVLNIVAPGPYLIGFYPFVVFANAVTLTFLSIVTGVFGIGLAFTYKTRLARMVVIIISVALILAGLYFLTWTT